MANTTNTSNNRNSTAAYRVQMRANQLNLADAAQLIRTVGDKLTIILRGQPGVGKSAILRSLAQQMPEYLPAYIDCADLAEGDLAMPVIDKENLVTRFALNERFGISEGSNRPVLLMLDEITKPASDNILNMLLPVLLERRLGNRYLPAGSIVFGSGNLDTDGVNDMFPAHAYNRICEVDLANPTADEWDAWADANEIAPEVRKFALDYPEIFHRYDGYENPAAAENPYIFNPLRGQIRAFCSPRSLAHSSALVWEREKLGAAFRPALVGTIGEAAANMMDAIIRMGDNMPRVSDIVASPDTVRLPEGAAVFLCAMMLATKFTKETAAAFITYVQRWDKHFEGQVLFAKSICGSDKKVQIAMRVPAFAKMTGKLGVYI